MTGNRIGGLKTAEANKKKHGPDFYARIGRMGGLKTGAKGFAVNRELASQAGRIGGKRSKRGPARRDQ